MVIQCLSAKRWQSHRTGFWILPERYIRRSTQVKASNHCTERQHEQGCHLRFNFLGDCPLRLLVFSKIWRFTEHICKYISVCMYIIPLSKFNFYFIYLFLLLHPDIGMYLSSKLKYYDWKIHLISQFQIFCR
jgi:hypothetical protein